MTLARLADKTDVANMMFAVIGESPISDIASTTDPAAVNASAVLDTVILETQADFDWSELRFCKALTVDAAYVQGSGDAYSYRFALPSDYLRPSKDVFGNVVTDSAGAAVRYSMKGGYVYADGSAIQLNYIRESDDVTEWSVWMIKCIYHAGAIMLAPTRSKSSALTERLLTVYERMVRKRIHHQASKSRTSERGEDDGRYQRAGRGGRF